MTSPLASPRTNPDAGAVTANSPRAQRYEDALDRAGIRASIRPHPDQPDDLCIVSVAWSDIETLAKAATE